MIGTDLAQAAALLRQGKLVGIPTETVYGLAANALDAQAIASIYSVKNRPSFNPLIVHVPSLAAISMYAQHVPQALMDIAQAFWPGAVSILVEKSNQVPDVVTAGSVKVVLRMPRHSLALELLQMLDFPLAAPSANISNTVSPTTAQHVEDGLGSQIPYILDGGSCTVGVESTILGFENGKVVILREGGVSREDIFAKTGIETTPSSEQTIQSPGQLKKHYSTQKPLYIVESINDHIAAHSDQSFSALLYEQREVDATTHLLSENYNLGEIANNLFATMRAADQDSTDAILIEPIREEGIGRAVADRLRRAASTFIS